MFLLTLAATQLAGSAAQAQPATAPIIQEQDLQATRDLVQDIQFILRRLGFDPGAIDGLPRQRTNRAVRLFAEMNGLPVTVLKRGGNVPAKLVARLRDEAARAMGGGGDKLATDPQTLSASGPQPPPVVEPAPAKTPIKAIEPALPRPPAPCSYDPEDFHIGPNRYTPDTFLKEGFDGSVTRAVARLQDRLQESRQIADKIGVSAVNEVRRQARVLQYFECRVKIEQASAN
jgi:peptidoglycan hydrolase-like protein with peptidoglycan-binding domain